MELSNEQLDKARRFAQNKGFKSQFWDMKICNIEFEKRHVDRSDIFILTDQYHCIYKVCVMDLLSLISDDKSLVDIYDYGYSINVENLFRCRFFSVAGEDGFREEIRVNKDIFKSNR